MNGSLPTRRALVGAAIALSLSTATPSAAWAAPPAGGQCLGPWVENTTLVNPDDPGFFDTIDKNGDGVICIKDWTGPDPDQSVGFLAVDNTGQHNSWGRVQPHGAHADRRATKAPTFNTADPWQSGFGAPPPSVKDCGPGCGTIAAQKVNSQRNGSPSAG